MTALDDGEREAQRHAVADGDDKDDGNPGQPGGSFGTLAVSALAGGASAAGGYYIAGPGGAAIGGAAAPYLAAVLQKTLDALLGDRLLRSEKMMEAAGEAAGLPPGQLAERASRSERTRHLTDVAIRAAADSFWPRTVQAIGRAFAAGLLANDEAQVDVRQHALEVMADLGRLDVILLELLVRYEPDVALGQATKAMLHRAPSYQSVYLSGGEPVEWMIGHRKWTGPQIIAVRPQLQPVLTGVAGTLVRHGLAEQTDRRIEEMEQITRNLQQQARDADGVAFRAPRPTSPRMQPGMERSWSPTELGEKVLGFYAEAGADEDTTSK